MTTATTEISTLSLHDALPISLAARYYLALDLQLQGFLLIGPPPKSPAPAPALTTTQRDPKGTRLNSSHQLNPYAGFCPKKKKIATSASPLWAGGCSTE